MVRKFYTIDDLYTFCKENRFERFSSQEKGAPLVVQSIGTFEASDITDDGLMPVKLKSCHTGKNANNSGITDENMALYKDTFKGKPILGAIYKTDTGEYEFRAHDMEIVTDGDETYVEYIEQPVGVISQIDSPYLEYDKEMDRNYLMVNGTIFSDYSRAAEILQRRKTCKCSVEIAVDEMSYNCKEDYLSIDAFSFRGVTILGYEQDGVTEIEEGMKGSKITIDSFSEKENSVIMENYQEKMIEVLDKLNDTLVDFNKKTSQKGGNAKMDKFNELLEKYGLTAEDVTFEYEELSDEELEAKFMEEFDDASEGAGEGEGETTAEGEEGSEDVTTVEETTEEPEVIDEPVAEEDGEEPTEEPEEEEVTEPGAIVEDTLPSKKQDVYELTYELSHSDVRNALYEIINTEENSYKWIAEIYESYFIYEDYEENWRYYRQKFTKDGENIALDGEATEVFTEWLTQDEKDALEALKSNYAELKSFKDTYDAEKLNEERQAVLNKAEYDEIRETEEFAALVAEAENYSVEELSVKADLIFAAAMKQKFNFAAKEEKPHAVSMNFSAKTKKKVEAYAGLFSDK